MVSAASFTRSERTSEPCPGRPAAYLFFPETSRIVIALLRARRVGEPVHALVGDQGPLSRLGDRAAVPQARGGAAPKADDEFCADPMTGAGGCRTRRDASPRRARAPSRGKIGPNGLLAARRMGRPGLIARGHRNRELFSGLDRRKHLASAARFATECRACTPGRRVLDPCSMDVQPCPSHLGPVISLRR
jgi:hypothetical protein